MTICHRCHVPKEDERFITPSGRRLKTCRDCRTKLSKEFHRRNTGAVVIVEEPQGIPPFPLWVRSWAQVTRATP